MPPFDNFHDLHREEYPHAVIYRKNSALTLNSGSWYNIPMNIQDYDPGGLFNGATGAYTAPVNGLYAFYFAFLLNATTAFACGEVWWVSLQRNAASYLHIERKQLYNCGATTIYPQCRGRGIVYANAGDSLRLVTAQTSGVNLPFYTGDSRYNYVMVERVGPYNP